MDLNVDLKDPHTRATVVLVMVVLTITFCCGFLQLILNMVQTNWINYLLINLFLKSPKNAELNSMSLEEKVNLQMILRIFLNVLKSFGNILFLNFKFIPNSFLKFKESPKFKCRRNPITRELIHHPIIYLV